MKDAEYASKMAFTLKQIISTQCNCPAGGCNHKRVVCIHNLPILYQMVMLLDDGLAEHFLVELTSRWHPDLDNMIENSGKTQTVRRDISILMQTAGVKTTALQHANDKLTIKAMLDEIYATGTQRSKRIPTPPSIKELRPISDVDFSSTVSKAKKRKLDKERSTDDHNDAQQQQSTHNNEPPDYYEIYTSMKAIGFDPASNEYPGFQLFMLRVKNALESKSESIVKEYIEYKKSVLKYQTYI